MTLQTLSRSNFCRLCILVASVLSSLLRHQVDDMERVLQYLEQQDPENTECWATRYMLLLWLAILVIIPFNMTSFDDGQREPIAQR